MEDDSLNQIRSQIKDVSDHQSVTTQTTEKWLADTIAYYTYSLLIKFGFVWTGKYIYMDPATEVVPGVYIGSYSTATNVEHLRELGISRIINLSGYRHQTFSQPTRMDDHPNDITIEITMDDTDVTPTNLPFYLQKFDYGSSAIAGARLLNKNILIHCAAGINRSACCIAYWLITYQGFTYTEAVTALQTANTLRGVQLLTNPTFRQLLQAQYDYKQREKCVSGIV